MWALYTFTAWLCASHGNIELNELELTKKKRRGKGKTIKPLKLMQKIPSQVLAPKKKKMQKKDMISD